MRSGRRVENIEALERAGDFCWPFPGDRTIVLLCPACGSMHAVGVKPGDPNGWEWNGQKDTPTLSPSIFFADGHGHRPNGNPDCRWHGWLRDGVWHDA